MVKKQVINLEENLEAAMQSLTALGQSILAVVDENMNLIGVLTDGDIRRAMLKGIGLKDKVKDVKVSKRLTTSASCLVADENDMDMHLKKLMAANNQTISDEKRILEININHSLVSKVMSLDKNSKDKFSEILYDHAKLMEGENLDDPKKYTNLIAELVSL